MTGATTAVRRLGSQVVWATAPVLTLCFALSGCTDSIAPPPTGQLDGGGPAFQDHSNDVPRQRGGSRIVGSARGTGSSSSTTPDSPSPQVTSDAATTETDSSGGETTDRFYEIAAEAGTHGPVGPAVEVDRRPAEELDAPAANHPPLTTFEPASEQLPPLDPATTYASIVDPAEGELPGSTKPVELASGGEFLEDVRFSSPAAGQAVVAFRLDSGAGAGRTRLDRYDLKSGELVSSVELPDRAALLDVSPDGSRALVRLTYGLSPSARPASSQTRLDVWELTESEGRHIVGWHPGESDGGPAAVPVGAVFHNGDRVAALTDDGRLTLWNLAESRAEYTIDAGGIGPLLATPGRSFLAVFNGTTFAAFEADTGTFRGLLKPPRPTLAACPDAAFSPDGEQLVAILQRPAQSLLTWNVAAGRPDSEFEAPLNLGRGLHCGTPGYVVAGGVLFDVARKKPVWLYTQNANCRNVGASPDRRHWIVMQPAFKDPVLQPVTTPTDEVIDAIETVSTLPAPRLGPGDALSVQLDLSNVTGDRDAIEDRFARELGQAFAARGLRLERDAERSLMITASEQPTGERISFNNIGDGNDEVVPTHEITFTVSAVDAAESMLWAKTGRVPPTYFLAKQDGKTLEEVLLEKLWERAPAEIANAIETSMPVYLRSVPPESLLGQTRLWAGVDDVSLPNTASTAATDGAAESSAGAMDLSSVTATQPALVLASGAIGVRDLAVTIPPNHLLITTGDDGVARVYQPVPKSRTLKKIDDLRLGGGATMLSLYPARDKVAIGTGAGDIRIYDLHRKNLAETYSGAESAITAVSVTWEPTLVGGTQDGSVFRWTKDILREPTLLAEGKAQVTALAAIPYQNRVVAAWADGSAKLIDVGTGEIVQSYPLKAGRIHAVAVSPDVTTIAFATESAGALLYSIETGEEIRRLDEAPVTAVAFRPDGVHVATANRFGRVVLWQVGGFAPDRRLEGAGGKITEVVFSFDGRSAAAVVAGRRGIPVWELEGSPSFDGADDDSFEAYERSAVVRSRISPRASRVPQFAHSE